MILITNSNPYYLESLCKNCDAVLPGAVDKKSPSVLLEVAEVAVIICALQSRLPVQKCTVAHSSEYEIDCQWIRNGVYLVLAPSNNYCTLNLLNIIICTLYNLKLKKY